MDMKKLDTLTIISALLFLYLVGTEAGRALSVSLMTTNPVLFYSVIITIAGIFIGWILKQVK